MDVTFVLLHYGVRSFAMFTAVKKVHIKEGIALTNGSGVGVKRERSRSECDPKFALRIDARRSGASAIPIRVGRTDGFVPTAGGTGHADFLVAIGEMQ